MGREKVLMKSETRMSAGQAAQFLRDLADKIDQQRVTLRHGPDELVLDLPGNLVLEVKVEEEVKGGKKAQATGRTRLQKSIEVELEWYEGDDGAAGGIELG